MVTSSVLFFVSSNLFFALFSSVTFCSDFPSPPFTLSCPDFFYSHLSYSTLPCFLPFSSSNLFFSLSILDHEGTPTEQEISRRQAVRIINFLGDAVREPSLSYLPPRDFVLSATSKGKPVGIPFLEPEARLQANETRSLHNSSLTNTEENYDPVVGISPSERSAVLCSRISRRILSKSDFSLSVQNLGHYQASEEFAALFSSEIKGLLLQGTKKYSNE